MPKTAQEVIQGALMHGAHPYVPAKYDPQKAHEYYERTKNLKGRKKGSQEKPGGHDGPGQAKGESSNKVSPSVQKQIAQLTDRLHALQARLRELMSKSHAKKDDGKKTASDKTKDARESKQYRDKHKTELAAKAKKADDKKGGGGGGKSSGGSSVGSMSETEVRAAIKKVRANLQAAVAKARQ